MDSLCNNYSFSQAEGNFAAFSSVLSGDMTFFFFPWFPVTKWHFFGG